MVPRRNGRLQIAKDAFLELLQQDGYTLIGEYVDTRTKVDILCPQKHIHAVTPYDFRAKNSRCLHPHCHDSCQALASKRFAENVAKRGYKLKGRYIDSRTKVLLGCPRGHDCEILPTNFNKGGNCRKCPTAVSEKCKMEFLALIASEGYILVGEYINIIIDTMLLCPKGDFWIVRPANFKNGARCRFCCYTNPEKAKVSFYDAVRDAGYTLIGEYINSYTKVDVLCTQKHECSVWPSSFKAGDRCAKCANNCSEQSRERFYQLLAQEGYKPLTPYMGAAYKLLLLCPGNHEWRILANDFKLGRRCKYCPHNLTKLEQALLDVLESLGYKDTRGEYTIEEILPKRRYDRYLVTIDGVRFIFEVDGGQHLELSNFLA